jgi:fructosamine-3-kinase
MDAPGLRHALEHALGPVSSSRSLGASAFCETWQARHGAHALFVQTAPTARGAMLQAEADGLRALAATRTLRAPQVACLSDSDAGTVLAMEWLGATPQSNTPTADWIAFFARHRLGAMRDRLAGVAHAGLRDAIDAVIDALPRFFDDGYAPAPALIHGDLWSGNWGMLADGMPVVFDPAVSCSDPEAELAMMMLFGGGYAGQALACARELARA